MVINKICFGLESILPELKKLNNNGIKFYLVNSPVPADVQLAEEETGFLLKKVMIYF